MSDDDIMEAMDFPMSSEMDPIPSDDFGWTGTDHESVENTDEDLDFQPVGDSRSVSEGEDDDVSDLVYINNEEDATAQEDVPTDDLINDSQEDSYIDEGGEVLLFSLSAKYKALKTKQQKAAMKKEEEDKWIMFEGKQQQFEFIGNPMFFFDLPNNAKPVEYYNKYLNDDILDVMVTETNRNATQVISKTRLNRSSRLRSWLPTNAAEMRKFVGLLLWMGLHPLPRISDYWCNKVIYKNNVAPKVMSRNRFQLLLRMWHFNDNENLAQDGRLAKINPLLTHLNDMFKYLKSPGQDVVIDESMVPFKGRLLFKQYLPKKTHKYGVKLFKICDPTGYTYRIIIYMGKGTGGNEGMSVAQSVVVDLMRGYLDAGRVVYLDNYYTSMDLGITLLHRSTHMVGTVTSNRAWFPHKKLVNEGGKHLEKGEMNCLEYPNGTVFSRWMDKREVRMVSTKHPPEFVQTGTTSRRGEVVMKPLVVVDYNKAKMGIDLSDQMSSYSSPVRRTMRWYHKVAEELLLGTAVVNSWLAYRENLGAVSKKNKYSITSFKEHIVYDLLGLEDEPVETVKQTGHHYLSESNTFVGIGKNKRRIRRFCKLCYKKLVGGDGRQQAKKCKKVTTFCDVCPNKPYLCKPCFQEKHK